MTAVSEVKHILRDGPVPKHAQLRTILLNMARTELGPDSLVPSERELMSMFGVSRATVREAIGHLVSEGHLYRIHGKGTFVARPRVETKLHLASFTQDMQRRGLKPHTVVRRVYTEEAIAPVAQHLRITDNALVWRVDRLRFADGEPMAVEEAFYPVSLFPNLDRHNLAGSLYEVLAVEYGRRVDQGDQTVWTEAAGSEHARLLEIKGGTPLMVFERLSMSGGVPVEHVTSWYRGDRYRVRMELGRPMQH